MRAVELASRSSDFTKRVRSAHLWSNAMPPLANVAPAHEIVPICFWPPTTNLSPECAQQHPAQSWKKIRAEDGPRVRGNAFPAIVVPSGDTEQLRVGLEQWQRRREVAIEVRGDLEVLFEHDQVFVSHRVEHLLQGPVVMRGQPVVGIAHRRNKVELQVRDDVTLLEMVLQEQENCTVLAVLGRYNWKPGRERSRTVFEDGI
mmetsp:Transcript_54706/g.152636  ORF Transcript_54706/g.152636 Transcript_54706/m.152636 type:complete len:202 (-) Transcript_54706:844-1449(-)